MNITNPINHSAISNKSKSRLNSISKELEKAYRVNQIFRTHTEAIVSVLNDLNFPTPASKWWQCVREQMVMLTELVFLSFEQRRSEIRKKQLDNQLRWMFWRRSSILVDIDECIFRQIEMDRISEDRVREIMMWEEIKTSLNDGSFDTEDVNNHQLVSFTTQFLLRADSTDISGMSDGEQTNLHGLLITALRVAQEQGVLNKVRKNLPDGLFDKAFPMLRQQ